MALSLQRPSRFGPSLPAGYHRIVDIRIDPVERRAVVTVLSYLNALQRQQSPRDPLGNGTLKIEGSAWAGSFGRPAPAGDFSAWLMDCAYTGLKLIDHKDEDGNPSAFELAEDV